jgi:CDP-glucose 4,6-dehydratase
MIFSLGKAIRELPGPVMLTGHTGFKGTWMTLLLEKLGIPVVGYSLTAEQNSLFNRMNRSGAIQETIADIRDSTQLETFIKSHKPSVIIHMAAQPLVLDSYLSPKETFDINVMGTASVLELAIQDKNIISTLVVTTDKVYKNNDSGRAFLETDQLGGKDPYSASKVGTEMVVSAFRQKARVEQNNSKFLTVRAGNVIGGGDFASNRLIPDFIRAQINHNKLHIRNPSSTRPWQHVLDPLMGYLLALEHSIQSKDDVAESFNFGPSESSLRVKQVIDICVDSWKPSFDVEYSEGEPGPQLESFHLELNPALAVNHLGWHPVWTQQEAVKGTIKWWRDVLENNVSPIDATEHDIAMFLSRYT